MTSSPSNIQSGLRFSVVPVGTAGEIKGVFQSSRRFEEQGVGCSGHCPGTENAAVVGQQSFEQACVAATQCRRATASGNRQAYAPALGGKDPAFGIDLLARSLIVFSIAMSTCCSHLRSAK